MWFLWVFNKLDQIVFIEVNYIINDWTEKCKHFKKELEAKNNQMELLKLKIKIAKNKNYSDGLNSIVEIAG